MSRERKTKALKCRKGYSAVRGQSVNNHQKKEQRNEADKRSKNFGTGSQTVLKMPQVYLIGKTEK